MRLMGIDYGTKRVGIALSDESGRVAFPEAVLENDKDLLENIFEIMRRKRVVSVVLGESKDNKGKDNPIMRDIRVFKKEFEKLTGKQIYYEPEFMTTAQVRRSDDSSEAFDSRAASVILQSYIDRTREASEENE